MLAYILAALVWWFIELNRQNQQMSSFRIQELKIQHIDKADNLQTISNEKKRKITQYAGEGITFFLLIAIAAVLFFRAIRRQLKTSAQQQNFMMAITHELKTPITISNLNLETIQKRNLEKGQQEKLISNTIEEMSRLNSLCNNLLLSSQMESDGYRLIKEEISLNKLANNAASEFGKRYLNRSVKVIENNPIVIFGDYFLLEMAINNLLDNALKYSPKDSPIIIQLNVAEGQAQINVCDEGGGIPEIDRKMVFEKFYRTGNAATRQAKGTGIGLYLVKMVTKAHAGNISVTDNKPKGSIFTLSFPLIIG